MLETIHYSIDNLKMTPLMKTVYIVNHNDLWLMAYGYKIWNLVDALYILAAMEFDKKVKKKKKKASGASFSRGRHRATRQAYEMSKGLRIAHFPTKKI